MQVPHPTSHTCKVAQHMPTQPQHAAMYSCTVVHVHPPTLRPHCDEQVLRGGGGGDVPDFVRVYEALLACKLLLVGVILKEADLRSRNMQATHAAAVHNAERQLGNQI